MFCYKMKKMPSKKRIFIIAAISFIATWISLIIVAERSKISIASPLAKQPSFSEKITEIIKPKSHLAKIVESNLKDQEGIYAVVIKNLKNGESFSLNENTQFTVASLYKLWVMAVAFEEINAGTLKESDSVSLPRGKIEEIQGFWQEGIDQDAYYSVADAIEQMIVVSDNDSAITLYSNIGEDKISDFLKRHNFTASSFGSPPKTTPKDIADYLEKLYKGLIVNREYSDKMLEILFKQRLNDRIPKYLPEQIRVAHKTGELDTFKHDAGIVELEGNDYLIIVMSDTPNPQNAAEVTALISKDVYDYFASKTP